MCILAQNNAGVLNTYDFPLNASKSNGNSRILRDSNNIFFGLSYDGLITEIKNNGEREICNPNIRHIEKIVKIANNKYYMANENGCYIVDNNRVIPLLKIENKYQMRGIHYFKDTSAFVIAVKDSQQICGLYKNDYFRPIDSLLHKTEIYPQTFKVDFNSNDASNFIYTKNRNSNYEIYSYKNNRKVTIAKIDADCFKDLYQNLSHDTSSKIIVNNGRNDIFFRMPKTFNYNFHEPQDDTNICIRVNEYTDQVAKFFNIRLKGFFRIDSKNKCHLGFYNEHSKSYNIGTQGTSCIAYSYIQKFPRVFNNNNTNCAWALVQDTENNIWTASYNQALSKITPSGKVINIDKPLIASNGSLSIGNKVYFIDETEGGIFSYHVITHQKTRIKSPLKGSGFYLYKSKYDVVYFGTANNGLWYITVEDLVANNGKWNIIPASKLGGIKNILTITEDQYGRIWCGHPLYNTIIFNPFNKSIELVPVKNKDVDFGMFASITDSKNNIWVGTSTDGLYCVNANLKNIRSNNFVKIQHPFFHQHTRITALTIYCNYLIINASDKTLVLDLEQYYDGVINLKYLTERESNYSSPTEQNTMLLASDSTIWYSTNDMLYQWDFKSWLNIPKEKINIFTTIQTKDKLDTIQQQIKLNPFQNSFTIDVDYYHPDLLPRYFSFALQYENDSILYSKPTTNTTLQYTNLAQGKYKFYLQVMELDGSLSKYQYEILIDTIWYKKWWVIAMFCITMLSILFFFYSLLQSKKKSELVAKNKALELENLKNATNLELGKLKVQSLANQIRPHFLLNTINTIGASIKERKAEKLLDNLANSINLLFNQSISGKNVHSIQQEWKICKNIIEIYTSMYLPEIEVIVQGEELSKENVYLPFGIMQIPIENALQHGLRNKISAPYKLNVQFKKIDSCIEIIITDNGVGLNRSRELANARKHGTGLKNIKEIIQIFNAYNDEKIIFEIVENDLEAGTKVSIYVPLNFNYEINI